MKGLTHKEVTDYTNLPEPTTTGCDRYWPETHVYKWMDRPGWQICDCGMKNWNPCEDERIFPVLTRQKNDD